MAQPVFSLGRHTRHDLFESILGALNAMPERLRKVFVLSHYQGHSPEEIASKLSMRRAQVAEMLEEANLRFFNEVRDYRVAHPR